MISLSRKTAITLYVIAFIPTLLYSAMIHPIFLIIAMVEFLFVLGGVTLGLAFAEFVSRTSPDAGTMFRFATTGFAILFVLTFQFGFALLATLGSFSVALASILATVVALAYFYVSLERKAPATDATAPRAPSIVGILGFLGRSKRERWIATGILVTLLIIPLASGGSLGRLESARGSRYLYLVTFGVGNGTAPGLTGNAPYDTTASSTVNISKTNLTVVSFTIRWQDNSVSPLSDPSVAATVSGPNWTGSATGNVISSGTTFAVQVPNEVPKEVRVYASSGSEAIALATAGVQGEVGIGDWDVALKVGSPAFGNVRARGSISFTIVVDLTYYEPSAKKL